LPNISANGLGSADWLHNKKSNDYRGPDQDYWSFAFTVKLTQPLFHWDYWIQLSQSDNQIAQAEAEYQAVLQKLIVRTTEAYFNVLSAQDTLDLILSEKQSISRQLDQAKQRFEVGLNAITDVYEAQAAFDDAIANEIEAVHDLENKKEALREIIGDNEVKLNSLGATLPLLKPEPANIAAWSDIAETNNFNIISALNKAEYSRKSIDVQRAGHLPQLDMVASYNGSDVNSTSGFRGDAQSVGVQLNVPLFEGGAVNSRTRQASYQYEAAKENLIATKRAVKREVKDAYNGVVSNIGRVEALKTAVTSAESALEASEVGFEIGTRTMVDVLAEQKKLYRTKRDFYRSRYNYLINSIKLKQASSELSQNDLEQINRLLMKNTTGKNELNNASGTKNL
ncbi:MAG: TolC family outer membrane protein, partial [Methylococcaceae bacterium]|nr:TolC family outer membrane protein [Methylococcaceae bacterium]